MMKVAINGLGRIGRAVLKIVLDNPDIQIVGINDLVPVENLAYLLKYDSVYGKYEKELDFDENNLIISGSKYRVYNEKDPAKLPWKDLGVDVVFECTGIFTKSDGLKKHIEAGAKRAVLSAPAKSDDITTVVHGVNSAGKDAEMFSCASCTTNCITPVAEIMERKLGVKKAMMTTIHAYTSSQGIVDSPSKKMRRGRAGAVNLVPTSTGAAQATTKVLTDMKGKFDGVAVRVPVPVGSITDIIFLTDKKTSVDEVNTIFKGEANSEKYKGILDVSEEELVSTDIIKNPAASIVDLTMTQVVDGDMVKVMAWYDNEWGYASQMVKEALIFK